MKTTGSICSSWRVVQSYYSGQRECSFTTIAFRDIYAQTCTLRLLQPCETTPGDKHARPLPQRTKMQNTLNLDQNMDSFDSLEGVIIPIAPARALAHVTSLLLQL